MKANFRILSICMILFSMAAWIQALKKKDFEGERVPFPWALARRSSYFQCSFTGQPCETTNQCCSENDVCLKSVKYDVIPGNHASGTCQNMRDKSEDAEKATPTLKASGQICTDSKECADGCCRELRGHRSRFYVCGPPQDDLMAYNCIRDTSSGNDVLQDLV